MKSDNAASDESLIATDEPSARTGDASDEPSTVIGDALDESSAVMGRGCLAASSLVAALLDVESNILLVMVGGKIIVVVWSVRLFGLREEVFINVWEVVQLAWSTLLASRSIIHSMLIVNPPKLRHQVRRIYGWIHFETRNITIDESKQKIDKFYQKWHEYNFTSNNKVR